MRRVLIRFLAVMLTLFVANGATPVIAQEFPTKPIRLIVPYSAGGLTDLVARVLQEPIREELGQTLIVENKGGAAGTIGAREVLNAPPDGYTLLLANSAIFSVAPRVIPDAKYSFTDFAPIARLITTASMLVIHPSLPVNNLKEFIEYAKAHPGKISYGTAGIGSGAHLTTELFAKTAGIELQHVPYRGMGPTTLALVNGEVQVMINPPSDAINEYVRAGKLKALAVLSTKPFPLLMDLPTTAEILPDFEVDAWFGIVAPAKTPPAVIAKLNAALVKAVTRPAIKERYESYGFISDPSTPEQLRQIIEREDERWKDIVQRLGLAATSK
jgi:tripartite-type tricarboxylate transporter receptor subunit TctC